MSAVKTITFPGITGIAEVNFTMGAGASPSVGTLICPRQTIGAVSGDLSIVYTPDTAFPLVTNTVTISDIAIDRTTIQPTSGGRRLSMQFMDRRWRWRDGHIDGEYNIYEADGTVLNEQTPQQLMALLLTAMGETGFDVSAVNNTPRPHVRWRAESPAQALESLCFSLGYYVCLKLSNTVAIVEIGTGGALPIGAPRKTVSFTANQGRAPNELRVATGNVQYQCKFVLEAVGLDTDDSVKLLNDLSYKPAAGWDTAQFPDFPEVTGTFTRDGQTIDRRELAKKSVYRWYRVKQQAHTAANFAPPGFLGTAADIDQLRYILPLQPFLNDEVITVDGQKRRAPHVVTGEFAKEDAFGENTSAGTIYPYSSTIDRNRGIVKFSRHVFKMTGGDAVEPADLRLTCVIEVTDPATNVKGYWAEILTDPTGTGIRTISQPDIVRKITANYNGDAEAVPHGDNLASIQPLAQHLAIGEQRRLAAYEAAVVAYAGIEEIDVDGINKQVRWRARAGVPSETVVSQNTEISQLYTNIDDLQRMAAKDAADRQVPFLIADQRTSTEFAGVEP